MTYRKGDIVRIIDSWVPGCQQNLNGRMDKWLGKFMTIREVNDDIICPCYRMEEDFGEGMDGDGWYWNDRCIEGLAKIEPEMDTRRLMEML